MSSVQGVGGSGGAPAPSGAAPQAGPGPIDRRHPAPIVRFDSVGKTFPDGTVAVDDVTLSVGPGEFVSIVGPSGCGKSTLLRLASNLTAPTLGRVESVAPGDLGYVFQDASLLPWRNVAGNVSLLCELHGVPRGDRDRRVAEAISLVGLDGFEKHLPHTLSGGMRMRVSLARSLTLEPKLFLFDEPFGTLDELTRQRLNEELLRVFVQQRFAVIFVTHSVSEAVYLSHRVLVLSRRPARIIAEIDVPFAFPRPAALRFDPDLVALSARVAEALGAERA